MKGATVFPLQILALEVVPSGLAVRRLMTGGTIICDLNFWLKERRERAARKGDR